MTNNHAIRTLYFQLSKSNLRVGPGLKNAIRLAIKALESAGPALSEVSK